MTARYVGRVPIGIRSIYESLSGALKNRIERVFRNERVSHYYTQWQLRHPATIFPEDTFLVSYPRSGNTWIRFLLTNLLWNGEVVTGTVDGVIPDIHQRANRALVAAPAPRLLKSHCSANDRYPKVIYIVRDGRDVAVSLFHRKVTRGFTYAGFSDFLERFLDGAIGSMGRWQDHVLDWLDRRAEVPFILVRYEDLKADTLTQLDRITGFLDLSFSHETLRQAIEAAEIAKMRRLEKAAGPVLDDTQLAARKGIVGDWRNHFSDSDRERFWRAAGDAMRAVGYTDDGDEASDVQHPAV